MSADHHSPRNPAPLSVGRFARRVRISVAITATVAVLGVAVSLGGMGSAADGAAQTVANSITDGRLAAARSITPEDDTNDANDYLIDAGPRIGSRVSTTGRLGAMVRVISTGGYPASVHMWHYSVSPATSAITVTLPTRVAPGSIGAITVHINDAASGSYVITIAAIGYGGVRTSSFVLHVR